MYRHCCYSKERRLFDYGYPRLPCVMGVTYLHIVGEKKKTVDEVGFYNYMRNWVLLRQGWPRRRRMYG